MATVLRLTSGLCGCLVLMCAGMAFLAGPTDEGVLFAACGVVLLIGAAGFAVIADMEGR